MNPYQLKKQAKEEVRLRMARKNAYSSIMKRAILAIVIIAILGWGGWSLFNKSNTGTPTEVISQNGIHWHTQLTIVINGENFSIPGSIGLGVSESPIHTHTDSGVIHMEFPGLVTTERIKLSRFFEIWGKTLTSQCIFENCANGSSTLTMAVNGKSSADFGNYVMRDNDKVLISFGKDDAVEVSKKYYDLGTPVDASK